MTSNEVNISISLSIDPPMDAATGKLKETVGYANIESEPTVLNIKTGENPQELLLNEEHRFTILISTSNPTAEYPPIFMQWNDGFQILSADGWKGGKENELDIIDTSDTQPWIRVVFIPDGLGIGILIVGTLELPVGDGK